MKRFFILSVILTLSAWINSACFPVMVDIKSCGSTVYTLSGRLAYSAYCGQGEEAQDAFFVMNRSGTHILHFGFHPEVKQAEPGQRVGFYANAVMTEKESGTIVQDYLCARGEIPEGDESIAYFESGVNPFSYSLQIDEPTSETVTCFEVGTLENANGNYLVATTSGTVSQPEVIPTP